jgi:nitrate/nitrite-specific signal transduction histidine kinase
LKIVIEDNGMGMVKAGAYARKREKHLHLGMEMTRKRLEILGKQMKVAASVMITEAFPGQENPGTRVEIIAPCCQKEDQN